MTPGIFYGITGGIRGGQFAPEWGGQFDAESLVTFRRNQMVNISGISTKEPGAKLMSYFKGKATNLLVFLSCTIAKRYL